MPISDGREKRGVADLLLEECNIPTLMQLAKSVTRNLCEIENAQDGFNYICMHVDDAASLLNKRLITKEILFQYLHRRQVAIKADFTKMTLVQKILEFWDTDCLVHETTSSEAQIPATDNELTTPLTTLATTQYPIRLLAHRFAEWFFTQYNNGALKVADFFSDARLTLRIAANDCADVSDSIGALAVIEALMHSRQQFNFYFNPNMTHDGVQGRIDAYGLVLVLVCGTLHTQQNCVGVFECTFGLLRDPYAENNWKVKTVQCLLRSQMAPPAPNLYHSESLRDALALPEPMDELL